MAGGDQPADHVVFGFIEARVLETHALGERAEHGDVRARFSGSVYYRPRELQKVVAVGEIKVGVFEEGSRGQQNVSVIGGVRLELFEHHGEEIVATEPRQDQVLIGSDGGGSRIATDPRPSSLRMRFRIRPAQVGLIY